MNDEDIQRELIESHAAVKAAEEARARRQKAVVAALDAGWSRYKIGKVLGMGDNNVLAIMKAAGRDPNTTN
jgi:hypothetical protein